MGNLYDELAAFEPVSMDRPMDIVEDDMTCRDAMIDIHRIGQEAVRLRTLIAAITERYRKELAELDEREDFLREQIARYLEITEQKSVNFPDIGRATLRRTPDKVLIADMDVVKQEYGERFVKPAFDETAFKQWAKERWLMDGELVRGIRALPEGRQVALSFK